MTCCIAFVADMSVLTRGFVAEAELIISCTDIVCGIAQWTCVAVSIPCERGLLWLGVIPKLFLCYVAVGVVVSGG